LPPQVLAALRVPAWVSLFGKAVECRHVAAPAGGGHVLIKVGNAQRAASSFASEREALQGEMSSQQAELGAWPTCAPAC
jgi:hypothetical protein